MAWYYSQRTGVISHRVDNGKVTYVGQGGYSGNGDRMNHPEYEHVEDHGPIPRGNWDIGLMQRMISITTKDSKTKHLQDAMRLVPDGHKAHGRSRFLIHGDNNQHNHTASDGCIILEPHIRHKIAASGDRKLIVTY